MKKNKNKDTNINKKSKDKLPISVFVCAKSDVSENEDYKQVFTEIISDRIKEKCR